VLSHQRSHLLALVLSAIAQLDYPEFEVVVVGDQPTLSGYGLAPVHRGAVKYRHFAEPNISAARNIAIGLAAGEIMVFCDDDAVPEPDWLRVLIRPFSDAKVGATAGTVLASDGLRVEWQGSRFDRGGAEVLTVAVAQTVVTDALSQTQSGLFVGLMGANCAFRREALLGVGGFDQAFRYYLDETDMALRLAGAGWSIAMAPGAVVHHRREANAARSALRVPRNLRQIAASKAYFCRRHLPADHLEVESQAFRAARLADLDRFVRLGALRGAGRRRIDNQLRAGLAEGLERQADLPLASESAPPAFTPCHQSHTPALRIAVVTGLGIGPVRRLRWLARRLAGAGHAVSCFSFLSGPHPRRVSYLRGVWLHTGGTWRLDHIDHGRRLISRASRSAAEIARVAGHRGFDIILTGDGKAAPPATRLALPGHRGALRIRSTGNSARSLVDAARTLQTSLAVAGDTGGQDMSQFRRNEWSNTSMSYS